MTHILPSLPYPEDALQPAISAETLRFHYGKHHRAYVDNLNRLTGGTPLEGRSLEEILRRTGSGPVFNNAAQVWNHTFYWNSLSPRGGGQPQGALGDAIKTKFGSFETFKDIFTRDALGLFGSGWAWLIRTPDGGVDVETTSNAGTPIADGKTALMTCDLWEHAYYVDFRNERVKYLEAFWGIVNWEFAMKNFKP